MVRHPPRARRDVAQTLTAVGAEVGDAAVGEIAPRPAARAVEHADLRRPAATCAISALSCDGSAQAVVRGGDVAQQGLGIMRGDHAPGERGVGEVLAIGVGRGVGQRRHARQARSRQRWAKAGSRCSARCSDRGAGWAGAVVGAEEALEAFKEIGPVTGMDDEHIAAVVLVAFAPQIAEAAQAYSRRA